MIKLSELENDELLYIILDNDEDKVLYVRDYKESELSKKNIIHIVCKARAEFAEIDIEQIIEDIAEMHNMYECWSENVINDIGKEKMELIKSILKESFEKYPAYVAGEIIDSEK
ncbi:MAG: hypothetical protein RR420_05335 [Anaerovoracaceae bacterium]